MRILVAIANHGTKNQPYLTTLLEAYRAMTHHVDIVVLSDRPKDLGPDVEVRVGAPTRDPRSLPFAHRRLFTDRVADYDLFIYSEDDTLITQQHVDAFIEIGRLLPEDEVLGFQRYEIGPDGRRYYSSIHSAYRWEPTTIERIAGETFADHTNLHAACYMVTQAQLRLAIASGGFDVAPHRGPFWSLMVSAASDIYRQCGLRRRLCVSRIDDFLVHHLPNVYIGKLGVDEAEYRTQLEAIEQIADKTLSDVELLVPTARLATSIWNVPQHPLPPPSQILLDLPSGSAERVLSIGVTAGAVEVALFPTAKAIVGVPVDHITSAVASTRGLHLLEPRLDDIESSTPEGGFDAILFNQTLHFLSDPVGLLQRLRAVASPDCEVLVAMPNTPHHRLRHVTRRAFAGPVPRRGFDVDGIHAPGTDFLRMVGAKSGIDWTISLSRARGVERLGIGRRLPSMTDRWTAREVYAVGRYRH